MAREVDEAEAARALIAPDERLPAHGVRELYLRRYYDDLLAQQMLICLVVEETATEIVVVTVYKSSRIARYLGRMNQ